MPPSVDDGNGPLTPLLARVAVGSIGDKLGLSGRPDSADDIPGSAESLTTEWLTSALCRGSVGAEVIGMEVTHASDGTSSRRAITVEYNRSGFRLGFPARSSPRAVRRSPRGCCSVPRG